MSTCLDHAVSGARLPTSRRGFVQALALGGGVTLFSTLPSTRARADGMVDAALLTCMDYRLEADVLKWMDDKGMREKYDRLVLAGASLGALVDQMPDWGRTFWQHVKVAIDLHHIKKVMVLDHRDCGAYKVFVSPVAPASMEAEYDMHAIYLRRLRDKIKEKYKDELGVELYLMALDGTVQTVT
jgi:carbonic anhydrase